MSLFKECERIKEGRKNGLLEEFENICNRILDIFADEPAIKSVRLENYPQDERITLSDARDDTMCISYIEYGEEYYLYYALGFYDLRSKEGYNEFLSDLLYYMYLNTNLVVVEESDSVVISLS